MDAGSDGAAAQLVEVRIEIPARSRNKYEFDEDAGALRLDRQLPAGLAYPADYGFLTGTLAEDGDALDALVLLDEPLVAGCLVRVEPLGALAMLDGARQDHKVLCVLPEPDRVGEPRGLADLSEQRLKEIEHFFGVYKDLEPGGGASTYGYLDRASALELIAAARRATTSTRSSTSR